MSTKDYWFLLLFLVGAAIGIANMAFILTQKFK